MRDGEGATKFVTVTVDVSAYVPSFSDMFNKNFFLLLGCTYIDAHEGASRDNNILVKTVLLGEGIKHVHPVTTPCPILPN